MWNTARTEWPLTYVTGKLVINLWRLLGFLLFLWDLIIVHIYRRWGRLKGELGSWGHLLRWWWLWRLLRVSRILHRRWKSRKYSTSQKMVQYTQLNNTVARLNSPWNQSEMLTIIILNVCTCFCINCYYYIHTPKYRVMPRVKRQGALDSCFGLVGPHQRSIQQLFSPSITSL